MLMYARYRYSVALPATYYMAAIEYLAKSWRLCDVMNQVTTLILTLTYR